MGLQLFERETTFGWDKSTNLCQCITLDQSLDRKLMGYCKKYPSQFKMIREQIYEDSVEGHEFTFPKSLITIRQPREKKQLTPEQKQAASERMKKNQEKIKKERKKTDKSDI